MLAFQRHDNGAIYTGHRHLQLYSSLHIIHCTPNIVEVLIKQKNNTHTTNLWETNYVEWSFPNRDRKYDAIVTPSVGDRLSDITAHLKLH